VYVSSNIINANCLIEGADALSISGSAPKVFGRTTRNGLPYVALSVSTAFAFLAFMGVKSGSGKVFGWFANMTSIAGLMMWFGVSITYIRFYAGLKAQGIDRRKLPYASALQPYAAWYAAVVCIFVCFVRTFSYHNSPGGLIPRHVYIYSSAAGPCSSQGSGTLLLS